MRCSQSVTARHRRTRPDCSGRRWWELCNVPVADDGSTEAIALVKVAS